MRCLVLLTWLSSVSSVRVTLLGSESPTVSAESLDTLAMMFNKKGTQNATADQLPSIFGDDEEEEAPSAEPKVASLKKTTKTLQAPTSEENPKCDQACTNGSEKQRARCMMVCAKMQKKICPDSFSCHKGCGNNVKQLPKDPECERLCMDVKKSVCMPLGFEAPKENFSPHHNEKPPPSVEATPAPRIFKGCFMLCNLYPASYEFDILALPSETETDKGVKMSRLGYKQCASVTMQSLQAVGVSVNGKISGVSRVIRKIPSVMVFGQWAFGNHQVDFNRYFAKGAGAFVCNAFPLWKSKDDPEPIQLLRGGYKGVKLALLKYKECVPTALKAGDTLAAQVQGKDAGEYHVAGPVKAIVVGKAGTSSAIAFEAWTGVDEVSF